MCGIAGLMTLRDRPGDTALIDRILDSQVSRGPDARATARYATPHCRVQLGHNRLSIIDLSVEANQPMASSAGDLHIIFNGEIYNYIELRAQLESHGSRFRTRSDTEVILEAYRTWGCQAFERFIGMFAIAMFDSAAGELVLVRDRFGVKPLYVWSAAGALAFASTPTVLAAWAGLKPDLDYVVRGISFKFYEDDSSATQYQGLSALEPGHWLKAAYADGQLQLTKRKFYDLQERALSVRAEIEPLDEGALQERLIELLRSACTLRLRSDVQVGLSVSGGVDSSSVAALMAEAGSHSIGYTFAHPDFADSEGPLVAQLAQHVKFRPRYVWPEQPQQIDDLFWRTLHAQDAPFPHVSIMAQHAVFQTARAEGTIVLLGGQGGDEAFMGYRKFFLFYAMSILRGRRLTMLPQLLATILPVLPAVLERAGVFLSERRRYASDSGMETRLRLPRVQSQMGLPRGRDAIQRQVLDVTRFSLPTLLRYEDRNSMGNSIESRLPFLDQRVVEFGIALPERMKLRHGFGKWLLRSSMAGRIPESIRFSRDKRGFDVNQQRWIEHGLGRTIRSALLERRAKIREWLPADADIDTMFSDRELGGRTQAFKEAVSLIWLAERS